MSRVSVLHELLDVSAGRTPDNAALRSRGVVQTYQQLAETSSALAASLRDAGLVAGDRVVINLQNRPEFIQTAVACSRLGAIFVPANPSLKSRQLTHLVRDSGASVLVVSARSMVSLKELLDDTGCVRTVIVCDCGSSLPELGMIRVLRFEDLTSGKSDLPPVQSLIADDPAALFYTSGSTGRAKGVIVSHRNLVEGAFIVAGYLHNKADDRILAALPLSFDYGFSQVTTAWVVGACAVLTNFSLPGALVQEIDAERITAVAGVPTIWMHMLSLEWPPNAGSTLRYITNSGGALPAAVIKQLQSRLPRVRIYCMYGLTEAFRSTYLDPAELRDRIGSIGKAIPGQQVQVLRNDGTECLPDEPGELVHRGSLVTLGYWNDPKATALRFRDIPARHPQLPRSEIGVWSGDVVRRDRDGYLYFVGRGDHLIKSSGFRISPLEIEEIASEVPGVIECAALGIPDETLGQRVVLAVAHNSDGDIPELVRQHCRMHLPSYMVPADVYTFDQLPRNPNGKCDRGVLQERVLLMLHGAQT